VNDETKRKIEKECIEWWEETAKKYYPELELTALKLQVGLIVKHTINECEKALQKE